jgi:hypothetical protein
MKKFSFLKSLFTPLKPLKLKFYFGKVKCGTPYFYPRKWVKKPNGSFKAIPKKIGFDFVGLGWKTKWEETDYRFEYAPLISFVFFKWQMCVFFYVDHPDNYWEVWLYYERNTDKTKTPIERIEQCKREFPQTYIRYSKDGEIRIDYYDLILR